MAQPRKLQDRFFKQAKAEGFAARSAYKLIQINERKRIIEKGDRVLDLGCAPGSWMQAVAEMIGQGGFVAGIDLKPVSIRLPPNARAAVGDVFKCSAEELGGGAGADPSPGPAAGRTPAPPIIRFDVILSDMAPNTEGGGGGSADHFKSIDLCRRVLELSPRLLKPGGNLVMKVFEGESYADLLTQTRALFADVKGFKPEASRDVSREMYIIARGFGGSAKGAPARPDAPPPSNLPRPRPGWGDPLAPDRADVPPARGTPGSGEGA